MDKIKIGIVGTGFSASFHIEALRRLPHVEVVAISGSSLVKAEKMAAQYAIPKAYGSPEELIRDQEIEAVHNCTPNDLHYRINKEALLAGKHLLSEKPLAIDSRESAELVELARTSAVVSGVCYNYRHYPLVAESKRRIADGGTGRIHLVTGGYLQDWLLEETDSNWRMYAEHGGATRAIADIGSHWCDLVQHVTGERIVEVLADLKTVHPTRKVLTGENGHAQYKDVPIDTEDCGIVMIHLEGGAQGVFTVSQVSAGRKNKLFFEISAASESLHWDQEQPNRLWTGRRGSSNREIGSDRDELSDEAAAMVHYPGGHEEGWPDGVKNLFIDFYAAVEQAQEGKPDQDSRTFASMEDGHYMMKITEAILESHKRQAWVKVKPD
ncbi:Gfo/Idh/MocA family protein [Paenibacillus nasutitermitis]|uniref:Dehydrogenase n=1 Tax=Paenibacillus nasutitermitis TaxID=1652958 RepID=A0A917DSK2_9BACL|nr:Gfo/Idh/MocA family oxidoreductase [Paenibacillus nasutitermitis]GGD67089.1 dehydrogenase [Paenibacillus nasutitermitis]